jgi:hypothetical protein
VSILGTLDQAKELMLEHQRQQQPVLSLTSSRPLLGSLESTGRAGDTNTSSTLNKWKQEKAAAELASETWNPEARIQMAEKMKELQREQTKELILGADKALLHDALSQPGSGGVASTWVEACEERPPQAHAPSAPGGVRKPKNDVSMPCPTVDVMSSTMKVQPSSDSQRQYRAPKIATRLAGCRRSADYEDDSSDDDSEDDSYVMDRRTLKAASSRADLGGRNNRNTDSKKNDTPQSDRKGTGLAPSGLSTHMPFNLDEGLAAIEKWSDNMDVAGGFHAVAITHAQKITGSQMGVTVEGVNVKEKNISGQVVATPAPARRGSRPVPGAAARPAACASARAQPCKERESGPESTSPTGSTGSTFSSPSRSPPSSPQEDEGEKPPACLSETCVSRSPRHLRKLCVTAGSRDELEGISAANSDDEEGEANMQTDEELIELLRKKPKHVPCMKTKDSFRQFFSCMKRERLHKLLTTAYDNLDAAEQNKKVKKRMDLMEGWVR